MQRGLTLRVTSLSAVGDPTLPGLEPETDRDPERERVVDLLLSADPNGTRAGGVFRKTFDMLYDGQHTGRYRWDQLFKTEKTHYGTMFEINFRREFNDVIDDVPDEGSPLDYRVLGLDIDCKYSQRSGGWMLPPECFEHLLLVATASDKSGTWSLGVVRASQRNRRESTNRDAKTQLNVRGNQQIRWLHRDRELPPNILLSLADEVVEQIFAGESGQARVNRLLRTVRGRRIGRNTIATVAQQDDYMARLRDNGGGARTVLRREGIIIPGDYESHRAVARALDQPVPGPGEVVSIRVVPASGGDAASVFLDGRRWRVAKDTEVVDQPAPRLPTTRRVSSVSTET